MAIDIRQALYYFGEITGEITNDDLLGNILPIFVLVSKDSCYVIL